jgi:hypothetical protein
MAKINPTTKIKLAVDHLNKALDALGIAADSDDVEFFSIEDIMDNIETLKEDIQSLIE